MSVKPCLKRLFNLTRVSFYNRWAGAYLDGPARNKHSCSALFAARHDTRRHKHDTPVYLLTLLYISPREFIYIEFTPNCILPLRVLERGDVSFVKRRFGLRFEGVVQYLACFPVP